MIHHRRRQSRANELWLRDDCGVLDAAAWLLSSIRPRVHWTPSLNARLMGLQIGMIPKSCLGNFETDLQVVHEKREIGLPRSMLIDGLWYGAQAI